MGGGAVLVELQFGGLGGTKVTAHIWGLAGVVRDKQVVLNPGRRRLQGGETGIVIGTSQQVPC